MGNRANLGFKQRKDGECIWLYMHWGGGDLPDMAVQAVEAARPRWGDGSYATRIALTELIGKAQGPLNYGVSTEMDDNEHDPIVIDWDRQEYLVLGYDETLTWYRMDNGERAAVLASARRLPFGSTADDLRKTWDRP